MVCVYLLSEKRKNIAAGGRFGMPVIFKIRRYKFLSTRKGVLKQKAVGERFKAHAPESYSSFRP